jgi:hypothetical protein
MMEIIKPLLSVETLTVLQLLGFNFKQAIGEPLTELVAGLIAAKARGVQKVPNTQKRSGRN